jgi:uncharacterized peroxidase-related enzyme
MARLPIQSIETATGSNKNIFAALQKGLGMVPNMARVMANSPAVLGGYAAFSGALASGQLAPAIREQIALVVAQHNACDYCLSAHTLLGQKAGLTAAQTEAARAGEAAEPKARAALALARAVLASSGGLADSDLAAARRAGLSDAELAETVAEVAINVFTNFFNRAFDVDIDFPRVEAGTHAGRR